MVSLLRKPLQESCCQVIDEEYGSVYTQLALLLPPKGALEDLGHVVLLSLLPLWYVLPFRNAILLRIVWSA